MSLYKENILEPIRQGLKGNNKGLPLPMPKLSKVTNYLERGQVISVGGKPSSGKTSYVDYIYFLNIFKSWRDLGYDEEGEPIPNPNRPPLKMFYFSMKSTIKIKMLKWMCLYLKMEHDLLIDIPTLTGGVGKMYDLSEEDQIKIASAVEFFDELEEHLVIVEGKQTPSSINNKIEQYLLSVGNVDEDTGKFSYDENHIGQYTLCYVDNTNYLLTETDGYQMMNDESTKKKLAEYGDDLKKNINVISSLLFLRELITQEWLEILNLLIKS